MRLLVSLALMFAMLAINASDFVVRDLVFLTRDGCVNTSQMKSRLDEALTSLNLPTDYQLIDVDKLGASDRRRGYGTPTVLYKNRDLFGKQAPSQASPPS